MGSVLVDVVDKGECFDDEAGQPLDAADERLEGDRGVLVDGADQVRVHGEPLSLKVGSVSYSFIITLMLI